MPTVNLTWTQAETIGPRIESYKVYRQAGNGVFVLLSTLPLVFGKAPLYAWTDPVLAYSDTTAAEDTSYTYRVDACTSDGRSIRSNEFIIVTPPPPALGFTLTAGGVNGGGASHYTGCLTAGIAGLDAGSLSADTTGLSVVQFYMFGQPSPAVSITLTVPNDPGVAAFTSLTFTGADSVLRTFLAADATSGVDGSNNREWVWPLSPSGDVFVDTDVYQIEVTI